MPSARLSRSSAGSGSSGRPTSRRTVSLAGGALVVLGDRNSRIKDFFDLHHLASRFTFDRLTLVEAVRRTFAQRYTPVPSEAPIGLTAAYWDKIGRASCRERV